MPMLLIMTYLSSEADASSVEHPLQILLFHSICLLYVSFLDHPVFIHFAVY